ncbi:MAG: AEC family transporter [Promethearchaeota archaeon]
MAILEAITELAPKLVFIYLAILLGVIWRFSKFYRPDYGKFFTKLVIWIFFPINILASVLESESIDIQIFLGIGLLTVLIHILSYVAITFVSKGVHKNQQLDEDQSVGAQALVASFPNALLYPFPVILATVGNKGLQFAAIFVFFALILRNSFGVYIGVRHSSRTDESSPNLNIRKIILEVTKFPPFVAMIVGIVILYFFGTQELNSPFIQILKDISIWGSLILVGLSFQDLTQLKPVNLFSRRTLEVTCIRFGFAPIIGLLFVTLWHFSPLVSFVLLIQCMSPPAVANIIYGKFFGLPEDEISIYISSVTFLALLILPLELFILQLLFPV